MYRDDPTIFAWELMNEPHTADSFESKPSWPYQFGDNGVMIGRGQLAGRLVSTEQWGGQPQSGKGESKTIGLRGARLAGWGWGTGAAGQWGWLVGRWTASGTRCFATGRAEGIGRVFIPPCGLTPHTISLRVSRALRVV